MVIHYKSLKKRGFAEVRHLVRHEVMVFYMMDDPRQINKNMLRDDLESYTNLS